MITILFARRLYRPKPNHTTTGGSSRRNSKGLAAQSLFGVLGPCKTPMGSRLLRTNILQPPNHAPTTELRLDAVEVFLNNEDMFFEVGVRFGGTTVESRGGGCNFFLRRRGFGLRRLANR